jgi:hypothetical protein
MYPFIFALVTTPAVHTAQPSLHKCPPQSYSLICGNSKEQPSRNAPKHTNQLRNTDPWRAKDKHMHRITIMNPNGQQLPTLTVDNRFKYFLKPKSFLEMKKKA